MPSCLLERRFVRSAPLSAVLPAPSGACIRHPVASPPGDVVGKITVGSQGWFAYGGTARQALAKGNYTRAQLQAVGVLDNWAVLDRTADTPNFVALSPNANDHLTSCRIQ